MYTLPNKRLLSVAKEVRQDATVADIGTDHAYLPIFLLKTGVARFAYLTDINEGPLARAKENAEAAGLSGRFECILTDGAAALSGLSVTDFCICGMGGELIRDIISRAAFLRDGSIQLLLQPMSREGALREYLFKEGFSIEKEIYSFDAGKYYAAFSVKFTGERLAPSAIECECGRVGVKIVDTECYRGYLNKKLDAYKRIVNGKREAGLSAPDEEKILAEYESRLSSLGEKI
jgi:tRNA (adenine22-N1)-methyltransferase